MEGSWPGRGKRPRRTGRSAPPPPAETRAGGSPGRCGGKEPGRSGRISLLATLLAEATAAGSAHAPSADACGVGRSSGCLRGSGGGGGGGISVARCGGDADVADAPRLAQEVVHRLHPRLRAGAVRAG